MQFPFIETVNIQNITIDKFLFLEAEEKQNLVQCSCWFGNSYYIFDIVTEKYNELLSAYPDNQYAEAAEYWILGINNYPNEGEPVYDIWNLTDIKKFMSKYPNSKLTPNIIIDIAESYAQTYD